MTKAEAMQALLAGDKITHRYFTADEHVYIDHRGHLADEKGTALNPIEFWDVKSDGSIWDNGWEIYLQI